MSWRALRFMVIMGLLAVAAACGQGATTAPTPTATATLTTAPSPTPTAAVVATPTGAPKVAATPTPTATPVPTATPTAQPSKGGELVQSGSSVSSYDAHNTSSVADLGTSAKHYNNLIWNPGGQRLECDLCQSYEFKDDGKTMIFHLVPGVKFHDGRALTSKDVVYSLNKMMGLVDGVVSPRSGLLKEYITKMETPDDLTVIIYVQRPAPAAFAIMAHNSSAIVPEGATRQQLKEKPLGSGPYVVGESIPGAHTLVKRNPNYFKPGLPYLDSLRIVTITDTNASNAAFLTEKVHIRTGAGAYSSDFLAQLEKLVSQGKVVHGVRIGLTPFQGILVNTQHTIFKNPDVRRAMHLALDRQAYAAIVSDGRAIPITLFGAGTPWGRPLEEVMKLPGYRQPKDQDIAEAKRLMTVAGYSQGIDVILEARNSGGDDKISSVVAADLAKINIRTTIKLSDQTVLYPRLAKLDYAIYGGRQGWNTGDPDEILGSYLITGGSRNWTGYSSPEMDALFLAESSELDLAKRKQLILQAEAIYLRDLPVVPGADPFQDSGWWSYVRGFESGISINLEQRMETLWRSQ
ncbi:MAG: ABC transporter substrate-binding protein [Chloroflexi bacterium]|nr:ABC transporter substrate-binding protein [Chloroflexota bacterium]